MQRLRQNEPIRLIQRMRFAAAHNLHYCPSFFCVNDTLITTLSIHKADPVVTGRTGSEQAAGVSEFTEQV